MKDVTQTIPGNYHVVVLPGGQLMAFTKLSNGEWVPTKDRLDEEKKGETTVAFEKRFEHTETVPNDLVPNGTKTLTPDIDKIVENDKARQNRLDAYLGEILGNPDDIISGVVQINDVKVARHKEHILGLMQALNSPKWNKIKTMIWK
jgi:hypothetical protein